MTESDKLPDVPSELIRLALSDLEKCEASESYAINMLDWHLPEFGVCHVCLAGAVMAQSLGAYIGEKPHPEDFGSGAHGKLHALDSFRQGLLDQGLAEMGANVLAEDRDVPEDHEDPVGFHNAMHALANTLEGLGL